MMMMMTRQRLVVLLLAAFLPLLTHAAIAPTAAAAATSGSRATTSTTTTGGGGSGALSNGLGQVIAGMAADGCDELTTACLLTSRSVTKTERQSVAQQLVGGSTNEEDEENAATASVMGNAQRALAVAQPVTVPQVANAILAAAGNVIYCPSAIDLARGEGLMESLGPAMQVIVSQQAQQQGGDDDDDDNGSSSKLEATLWIVVDNPQQARQQLQASIDAVLSRLVCDGKNRQQGQQQPLTSLEDVFTHVQYVTPAQALEQLTNGKRASTTDAASRVAIASKTSSSSSHMAGRAATSLTAADLAAARTLGPVARQVAADAVATVHAQCRDDQGLPVRVTDFGQLADAAIQAALDQVQTAAQALPKSSSTTSVATQTTQALRAQLEFTLQADWQEQLELLSDEAFQAFRKSLSKLIIGPNLAQDMQKVAQTSVAAFAKQARRLVAPSCRGWSTTAAQATFATRLRDTVTSRLQTARASGKFRPLPRKGVTIGLHWLLPKPFGNDYRQEPWLVHASDNLVYVPTDKITEVSPEAAATGDWRNQIVPSPVGNDMIFMQ